MCLRASLDIAQYTVAVLSFTARVDAYEVINPACWAQHPAPIDWMAVGAWSAPDIAHDSKAGATFTAAEIGRDVV